MEKSILSPQHRELAKLLKKIRVERGLTQVQVAERLGRHHPFVHDYERAQRRLDVVRLKQVAYALGTSLVWIVAALEDSNRSDLSRLLEAKQVIPVGTEGETWYRSERNRLSALLRTLRTETGLTEVQLARALDTSQSFVAKYENGTRRLDLVELGRIAKALGYELVEVVSRFETERG